jgi:anti-anti-sigma factor
MSELARLEVEQRGTACVVRIRGEVDVSNAHDLSVAIGAAMPSAVPTLVVDLTHTTYLDSAGLQMLFMLAERLRARRQALRLIVPKDSPVRAVIDLTALSTVAPIDSPVATDPGQS